MKKKLEIESFLTQKGRYTFDLQLMLEYFVIEIVKTGKLV